jgi:hypothetical protein
MDINENVNRANRMAIRVYGAFCLTVGVMLGMVLGKVFWGV